MTGDVRKVWTAEVRAVESRPDLLLLAFTVDGVGERVESTIVLSQQMAHDLAVEIMQDSQTRLIKSRLAGGRF